MGRLQKGVNDLESWCLNNGLRGKQLMSEWTGECNDGKHYEIDEVSRSNGRKKFKWICSKGHEWYTAIYSRTARKYDCPCCYNEVRGDIIAKSMTSKENSLKNWCQNSGDYGKTLIDEWTGECDNNKHYEIDEVAKGSNKKFKWQCSEGHEWLATVNSRTGQKSRCPFCFQKSLSKLMEKTLLSEENSLKTWCMNNGSFGKQLMTEWTGIREDGEHYKIDEVAKASNKKFKWICSQGHEWFAKVNDRTRDKTGCPYCSDKCACKENCLKSWCLANGSWGKQLLSEWTGESVDGTQCGIDEVTRGSKKKFKWRCSKDHEWYATVCSRTAVKCGCPYCNNPGTSYAEQFIYHSLKQIFPNAQNRCRVLKSVQNPKGVEFDVGVPEVPLCIEYSPTYWHEGREERDQYKKDLCSQCGIRLIQIIEDRYNELKHTTSDNYICFKMNYHRQDEILTKIVDYILKSLGHSISEIDIERVKQEAYESSKGIEKEIQDTD